MATSFSRQVYTSWRVLVPAAIVLALLLAFRFTPAAPDAAPARRGTTPVVEARQPTRDGRAPSPTVIEAVRRAEDAGIEPVDVLVDEAAQATLTGRLRDAVALLEEALTRSGDNAAVHRQYDEAVTRLTDAIDGHDRAAAVAKARLQDDVAVREWQAVLALADPDAPAAARARAGMEAATPRPVMPANTRGTVAPVRAAIVKTTPTRAPRRPAAARSAAGRPRTPTAPLTTSAPAAGPPNEGPSRMESLRLAQEALDAHAYGRAIALLDVLAADTGATDAQALLVKARAARHEAAVEEQNVARQKETAGDWHGALNQYAQAVHIEPGLPGVEAAVARVRTHIQAAARESFTQARVYDAQGVGDRAAALYEVAARDLPEPDANRDVARARLRALRERP